MQYRTSVPVFVIQDDVDTFCLNAASDMTFAQVAYRIRIKMNLRPEEGLFYFINGTSVPHNSETIGSLFRSFHVNYILHIRVKKEVTYG